MQSVRRILVIDDDPAMLSLAKLYLSQQGYEVMLAGSSEQCLKLVDENRFDLALVDFQLPDWDGIELIRRLKEVAPETDIIMITGFSSVSHAVEAIRAGAFYYIEKPIDFDELFLLIEKVFEQVESVGLKPITVDVAPLALYNAVSYNYSDEEGCTLVLDIGARTTNLIFVEPRKVFTRTVPIAGNTITQSIVTEFDSSFEKAEDLKIRELVQRLQREPVKEVILATNISLEGEATAMYLQKQLTPLGARVTRLARGLPVGGDLEYADETTLARALSGRSEM